MLSLAVLLIYAEPGHPSIIIGHRLDSRLAVWRFSGNALVSINVVTLR